MRRFSVIPAGPIQNIQQAERAIRDLELVLEQIYITAVVTSDTQPTAGNLGIVVAEDDGSFHYWQLMAGAGVTITADPVARTLTFTSP